MASQRTEGPIDRIGWTTLSIENVFVQLFIRHQMNAAFSGVCCPHMSLVRRSILAYDGVKQPHSHTNAGKMRRSSTIIIIRNIHVEMIAWHYLPSQQTHIRIIVDTITEPQLVESLATIICCLMSMVITESNCDHEIATTQNWVLLLLLAILNIQ